MGNCAIQGGWREEVADHLGPVLALEDDPFLRHPIAGVKIGGIINHLRSAMDRNWHLPGRSRSGCSSVACADFNATIHQG